MVGSLEPGFYPPNEPGPQRGGRADTEALGTERNLRRSGLLLCRLSRGPELQQGEPPHTGRPELEALLMAPAGR